ncbi:unnamed protein product, partial [Orchesella dallaii]
MSITIGCLNLQFAIQSLLRPPYQIDPNSLQMLRNPWYTTPYYIPKLIWNVTKINLVITATTSLWTVLRSIPNWRQYQNLEALGFYSILTAIACIAWNSYRMLDVHLQDICYLITQRFKLLRVFPPGWPTKSREPQLQEMVMYCFGIGFGIFPLVVCFMPLIRDYDPYVRILFKLFSISENSSLYYRYFVKVLVSVFYGGMALHAAGVTLSTVLLSVMVIEATQKLSCNLYKRQYADGVQIKMQFGGMDEKRFKYMRRKCKVFKKQSANSV